MMVMCLAVTIAWMGRTRRGRPALVLAGILFFGGCVAAGSFSGIIGLGVVVLALGLLMRRLLAFLAGLVPAGVLAAAVFWPVIAARLAGFDTRLALPPSWLGRLENLQRFFWPELFSGWNWLWGVRPAARVVAPESWRQFVFIESGHTWLLWVGGVPLLVAYLLFTWVIVRTLAKTAVRDPGPIGVAASAGMAAAAMIFVLMLFDPHLTVRGSADLFFPLIALSLVGQAESSRRAAVPENPTRPSEDAEPNHA